MKKTMVAFTIALALNTQAGIVYWNAPDVDFYDHVPHENSVVMLFVVQTPEGGAYHEINALLNNYSAFTGTIGGLILDAVPAPKSGDMKETHWFESPAFADETEYEFDLFVFSYYPHDDGSGAFVGSWQLHSQGFITAGGPAGEFNIHPDYKDEWGGGLYYNIPEPTTGLLALCGAAALLLRRRKRT